MSMDTKDVVAGLIAEFSFLIEPLERVKDNPKGLYNTLASFGWNVDGIVGAELTQVVSAIDSFKLSIEEIASIESFDDIGALSKALAQLQDSLDKVDGIRVAITAIANSANYTEHDAELFTNELFNYLLIDYLAHRLPKLYESLMLFGIICFEQVDSILLDSSTIKTLVRYPIERPILKLGNIKNLLSDPVNYLKEIYLPLGGIRDSQAASRFGGELFGRIESLVFLLGGQALVGMRGALDDELNESDSIALLRSFTFAFPILDQRDLSASNGTSFSPRFGATLIVIPSDTSSSFNVAGPGVEVVPFGIAEFGTRLGEWNLDFGVTGSIGKFFISPDVFKFAEPTTSQTELEIKLSKASANTPAFLVGSTKGTRLEVGQFTIKINANLNVNYQIYGLITEASSAAIIISAGDGDGFLQKVLPKDGIQIDFDLAIGWSNKQGLYFRGGAGLETTLPINKNLFDVLLINSVYLAILVKESGVSLAAATSMTLKMGPVVIAIEQMGLQAKFTFPQRGGNLGPINLEIGFKPPKGAGLVIDASAVVGAGFLEFDPDNEMYAGFVYLEIVKKISVTAVGLITTRMPDGSPGFSLLALIAVQFSPGIQLGYGFTLNGLGGLLGINRTVKVDVLRNGLRNGTLGSILFPSDPKKNIARIISDLKAVFPPAEGRFVFGPMVILGWGPNELIKLELGIIIELPDPVRLLILGRLSLKLPDEKNPVVRLKLDSLGVIEFATGDVSLDAVLYDSEIKGFTITGEMALRANFGASPGFLLSVGGFHPAFKAPPGFPTLQRVAISLATGDNPRLRLAAYMAITTNTVQFGGALEIFVKAGEFNLEGQLSFDALIQFDPFGLAIGLGAMIAVKSGKTVLLCIKLELNLTGPTPWHAWGEAVFRILLFDIRIPIEFKSGEAQIIEPPAPVDIKPLMIAALAEPTNWSTQLPLGEHSLVVFREQAKGSTVLVHPLAILQVNQRVAPLNRAIYKFGNTPVEGGNQVFNLSVPEATDQPEYVKDWFAPAHFYEMTDDEKIAAESFVQWDAGIRFTQDGYSCGTAIIENEIGYETGRPAETSTADTRGHIPGSNADKEKSLKKHPVSELTIDFVQQVACLGAVGQSLLRKTGTAKYQSTLIQDRITPIFNVKPRSYMIVGSDATTQKNNLMARKSNIAITAGGDELKISSLENGRAERKIEILESYTAALELQRKNRDISLKKRTRLKIIPL